MVNFQSKVPNIDSGRVVTMMKRAARVEWWILRSSREFAMMLAAAVVDHVQDVIPSVYDETAGIQNNTEECTGKGILWEEIPLYPVLADMVLVTLRRQFHLLVHPTDPKRT